MPSPRMTPGRPRRCGRSMTCPGQRAILGSLAHVVYPLPAQRDIELWRVTKDSRELRCIALYLPTGIELRLHAGRGVETHATAQRRHCGAGAGCGVAGEAARSG